MVFPKIRPISSPPDLKISNGSSSPTQSNPKSCLMWQAVQPSFANLSAPYPIISHPRLLRFLWAHQGPLSFLGLLHLVLISTAPLSFLHRVSHYVRGEFNFWEFNCLLYKKGETGQVGPPILFDEFMLLNENEVGGLNLQFSQSAQIPGASRTLVWVSHHRGCDPSV